MSDVWVAMGQRIIENAVAMALKMQWRQRLRACVRQAEG